MKAWIFQSSMSRGELDPQLGARLDIDVYYNGLKDATNVLPIPQGGVKKRPGTRYLFAVAGDGRLENFSFNLAQSYLLAFTDSKMYITKNEVLQTNINGSGNSYAATPWSLAQIQEFDYIQSADTGIVTHEDVAPQRIVRSADTTWIISALPLTNIPQFDFNDADSPTPVDEVQTLNFANQNEGDRYKIALNGILTNEIVWANDDTANQNAIATALLNLSNTASTGIAVTTDITVDTYRVTFSGSSAKDWDLMTVSAVFTQVAAFGAAAARIAAGSSRSENVWSATRGWPRTCTFHEGRLWFGGSQSKPNTLWGSVVFDFFNFDVGRGEDDRSVSFTLDTDQLNTINGIFSNRSLQIFTSAGEFYVPQDAGSPITPSNVAVSPQSKFGSSRVRPVSIDGVTIFPQRTGKALIQYVYSNDLRAHQSRSVSVLAPHLIKSPVQMCASRGTETNDTNYVYIFNNDGTITVFNSLIAEDVTAFTSWSTDGLLKSGAVVSDELYTLVEREVNGSTVYYIEIEDESQYMDSTVIGTGLASDTLTGLSHLEAKTVKVRADGDVELDQVVSGGSVTISQTVDTIEAGLGFSPRIETMPLNINLQNGPIAAKRKRKTRAAIHVYNSNGVIVDGERLPDKTIGVNVFDSPTPQTELKRIYLHGYDLEATLVVTQDTPVPWQILSVGVEVNI